MASRQVPPKSTARDSWVRNYEAVDYDVPLLHPHARMDSGDEDDGDDAGAGREKEKDEKEKEKVLSSTPLPQGPPAPPKNPTSNPTRMSISSPSPTRTAFPQANDNNQRLPVPARARTSTHTRGVTSSASPSSSTSSTSSAAPLFGPTSPASPGTGTHINLNVIGSGNLGSIGAGLGQIPMGYQGAAQPPSATASTTTTATSTATATGSVSPRTPRPSSFRSSPLAQVGGTSSASGGTLITERSIPRSTSPPSSTASPPTHHIVPVPGPIPHLPSFPTITSSSSSSTTNPGLSASTSLSMPTPTGPTPPTSFPFPRPPRSAGSGLPQPPTDAYPNLSLGGSTLHGSASRGSMILYRLSATEDGALLPPPGIGTDGTGGGGHMLRSSMYSNSGDSIVSLAMAAGESKYPPVSGTGTRPSTRPGTPGTPGTPAHAQSGSFGKGSLSTSFGERELGRVRGGLVAYVYDPDEDVDADELDEEEEEWIRVVGGRVPVMGRHGWRWSAAPSSAATATVTVNGKGKESDKKEKEPFPPVNHLPSTPRLKQKSAALSWRGLLNVGTLVVLITALMSLFIVFPVTKAFTDNGVSAKILGNIRINATGQAESDVVVDGGQGGTVGTREVKLEMREWRWEGFGREP